MITFVGMHIGELDWRSSADYRNIFALPVPGRCVRCVGYFNRDSSGDPVLYADDMHFVVCNLIVDFGFNAALDQAAYRRHEGAHAPFSLSSREWYARQRSLSCWRDCAHQPVVAAV